MRSADGPRSRLPADIVAAVHAAQDKKATDVVVLDLRAAPAFTDYFVICSARNVRQVHAIVDSVEESLRTRGVRPSHVEGYESAGWVLLDYFDFVVHVFNPETRAFYDLERLWGSARRIEIPEPERPESARQD